MIDGDKKSTTQKITKTKPLTNKKEITETAIAGELLGKKLIYLEAGSGAKKTVYASIIKEVKKNKIQLVLKELGMLITLTRAVQAL